ncbi:MAG: hypothetical protein HY996_11755 [Micrococcales bacterium]|nr:hypothetical protein [Micrococcales bacterium]
MSGPRPVRDRHARPARFPWLVPVIVAVAAAVIVGAVIAVTVLGIRWF